MEKIVETKKCKCGASFEITDKDMEFYAKISPVFAGKKFQIPTPTLCPDCRQQRRLGYKNDRNFYHRKCDGTGKPMLSTYSETSPYKVYEMNYYRSDKRNPMDYGRDYDQNKTFFEQFKDLYLSLPKVNLNGHLSNENCCYVNYFVQSKDCYLCFGGGYNQNVLYSDFPVKTNDSMDVFFCTEGDNLYQCSVCINCHSLFYSYFCESCRDGWRLEDCIGCNNCFGCIGLRNAQNYIFNQECTEEEFNETVKKYLAGDADILQKLDKFTESKTKKSYIRNSENCSGNNIMDSQNCIHSRTISGAQDFRYIDVGFHSKDAMDCDGLGLNTSLAYETMTCSLDCYRLLFSMIVRNNSSNLLYCTDINSCQNCFGCAGLDGKSYCILNKQYTKEEYEKLVPQIIEKMQKSGERGEFWPASMCPFAYNETVAMEYFSLSKKEAEAKGYRRTDRENSINISENLQRIKAGELPENIDDVEDSVLEKIIICEVSGRPFRIIKQEVEFLRKHGLPIPHKHPDVRHIERMRLYNRFK